MGFCALTGFGAARPAGRPVHLTATPCPVILKSVLNQSTADRVFDALGDPTRRALVARLSRGPMSVSELGRPFGITLAAVVQHVQVLERSRLVRTAKVGRVRTCWVEPAGLDVAAAWLAERRALWERRLDRLGDALAEQDQPTARRDERG
jgi:DNA-binding transcriptional ArsR family regulator